MAATAPQGRARRLWIALAIVMALPGQTLACACGCGVFGVGTSSLLPTGSAGQAFFEYDFMNQNRTGAALRRPAAADNSDKEIRTDFYTLGGQHMINRRWGVMAEIPYWSRTFRTDPGTGVETFRHSAFGDARLEGVYTGLAADLSTGLIVGVKLPTGDFRYPGFDRDTEIGTGSTDALVGGYKRGALSQDETWGWFVQGLGDLPLASQGGYRPGAEFDGAAGLIYAGFSLGGGRARIAPVLQVVASVRTKDSGPAANPGDSGYSRLILSPGVQIGAGRWKVYGDVEFPVAQRFNGHQLAAAQAFKVILSRDF